MVPENLRYTESHEWGILKGNVVTVGITQHAQEQLSDIVYVELPDVDKEVAKGDECAVIESTKIAAELYAPLAGKVVGINEELQNKPELINQDPYGEGWVLKIELSNPSDFDELLDAKNYQNHVELEDH
jgi:glycine cleavage system H protein